MLKHPGRIGHCAHFGVGIWAEKRSGLSVAISVSGCGEVLVRTHFAESLAEKVFEWFHYDSISLFFVNYS